MRLIAAVALSTALSAPGYGQDPPLPNCQFGAGRPGVTDAAGFAAFDRDLRSALADGDLEALSLLVRFPLRVNSGGGTIHVADVAALQGRFDSVFPAAMRARVAASGPESVVCGPNGQLGYAHGVLWVDSTPQGFLARAVNLQPAGEGNGSERRNLQFRCVSPERRLLIDGGPDGSSRLRSWDRSSTLSGPADLEIHGGTLTYEGTGPCRARNWSFATEGKEYAVEEGSACGAEATSAGTRGGVVVSADGTVIESFPCY